MLKPRTIPFASLDCRGLPFHLAFSAFAPGQRIAAHDHDFYEIFLVQAGRLRHQVNRTSQVVKKGDMVFLRPEDTHWFRNPDQAKSAKIINVALPRDLVVHTARFLWDGTEQIPPIHRTIRPAAGAQKEITGLVETLRTDVSAARARLVTARVLELFSSPVSPGTTPVPAWLDAACEAMRKKENCVQGIRRFVALSGKTQEHLTRTLRTCLNTTPTAFINRLKAAEAARLLETTDLPVLDIVYEAGFNNVSHFINSFRRFHGTTPRQFRKNTVRVFRM